MEPSTKLIVVYIISRPGLHNDNVPCAVCVNCFIKVFQLTQPALPPGQGLILIAEQLPYVWTKMLRRCVVRHQTLMEPCSTTQAVCSGIECPPYDPQKELTRVVCNEEHLLQRQIMCK